MVLVDNNEEETNWEEEKDREEAEYGEGGETLPLLLHMSMLSSLGNSLMSYSKKLL